MGVWGGASDSIFTDTCTGHNCFGTFSLASTYLDSGLLALDTAYDTVLEVALIQNSNAFSSSTCDGAASYIEGRDGLSLLTRVTTSAQYNLDIVADQFLVDSVISMEPDVVAICGHNGFVEPVIIRFGEQSFRPKAILSTNALNSVADANFGDSAGYQNCIMMPTQWDDLAETAADSITGMTNAAFDALLGDKASYHAASAYAAGIVITHAMASSDSSTRIENLPSLITNLPVLETFYGTLSWYANGSPTKEMFTMQEQADVHQIVAPADASTADLSTDLADCLHWVVSASTRCVGLYAPFLLGLFMFQRPTCF